MTPIPQGCLSVCLRLNSGTVFFSSLQTASFFVFYLFIFFYLWPRYLGDMPSELCCHILEKRENVFLNKVIMTFP